MGAMDLLRRLFGTSSAVTASATVEATASKTPTADKSEVKPLGSQLAGLTHIRGVGETIASNLVAAGFGAASAITAAREQELLDVPGVGPATVARLKAYAAGDPAPQPSPRARALDREGQPTRAFNASRRIDRGIHEMLGLCRGVLADGVVSTEEALLLANWLQENQDAAGQWPAIVIVERLDRIFADGIVEPDEREDLTELLREITGTPEEGEQAVGRSTTLPLTRPAPALEFDGWEYVFTGRFASGTRGWCQQAVERMGATTTSNVTLNTNVLVIGTYGSRDWAHSSYGRKIQKAVQYQERGNPIAIVDESHWVTFLK